MAVTDQRLGKNDNEMVLALQKVGIESIPSSIFNSENFFVRLCFAVDDATLKKATDLISKINFIQPLVSHRL